VTRRAKGLAGLSLLLVLLGLSLLPRWIHACPFGMDLEFPTRTVCERALGGLARSMALAAFVAGLTTALGIALALVAAQAKGPVDFAITKVSEFFFTLPDILVLITVAFLLKTARDLGFLDLDPTLAVGASLSVIGWAVPALMFRARLQALGETEFVAASRALGAGEGWILVRHLLPQMKGFVLAVFLLRVPAVIFMESTISFLGFGLPPTTPSLGTYVGSNYRNLILGEWRIVLPVWALLLLISIGFSLLGKAFLEDA
jgi:peptide/nickel transport system permease protein